ncbi:MAG: aspartyl protease family protein [Cyclobacteriaceae bacterium]|nr:aspartyl protease family protein [Cyclobacteriaceae bacterium]
MVQRIAGILVALSASFCTQAQEVLGFSLAEGRQKVSIPIQIQNNLVIVPVVLNGQLPLKFILDTGVRTSILTEKLYSDILNLSYSRRYSIAGPGGEKLVEAYVTNNVSLTLPGVNSRGHALLVLEKDYLELRNTLGMDVHGVLGYELFSRFIVDIDYEQRVLTLMLPERFKPGRRYAKLPISIEDTKPYVETTIQVSDTAHVAVKLMMDSGASHGLLLEQTENGQIRVPDKHVNSIIGRGLGGVITGQIGRIKSIQLGRYELEGPLVNFPDEYSYRDTLKTSGSVFRNGTIGGEVLSRFHVIFDFPREVVYLKKNAAYRKGFFYNMSGITLKAKGSRLRNFEVTNVRPDSPAARADIKTGDDLVVINGARTSDLTLDEVIAFLNQKPGKKLHLEVSRQGERLKKLITLENSL